MSHRHRKEQKITKLIFEFKFRMNMYILHIDRYSKCCPNISKKKNSEIVESIATSSVDS